MISNDDQLIKSHEDALESSTSDGDRQQKTTKVFKGLTLSIKMLNTISNLKRREKK